MMHIPNPEELGGEKERERPGSGAGWAVTEDGGGAPASLPPLFSSLLEKNRTFFTQNEQTKGDYFVFKIHSIQHCFICRPSYSTVSEDAGIEPRSVGTTT
jgi:hypothetical protein